MTDKDIDKHALLLEKIGRLYSLIKAKSNGKIIDRYLNQRAHKRYTNLLSFLERILYYYYYSQYTPHFCRYMSPKYKKYYDKTYENSPFVSDLPNDNSKADCYRLKNNILDIIEEDLGELERKLGELNTKCNII